MFGNQQNDPRVMKKKSDPSMSESVDDSHLDKQGYILAVPAKQETGDGQSEADADDTSDITQSAAVENNEQVQPAAEIPSETPEADESETQEADDSDASSNAAKSDSDNVEEELNGILSASQTNAEVPAKEQVVEVSEPEQPAEAEQPIDSEESAEGDVADENTAVMPADTEEDNPLLDLYYYMMESEKNRDYYPNEVNYYPYRRRRSSSGQAHVRAAATEGGMTRNVLKRSRRIKRDLLDDVDGYYYPYGYEEGYEPELSDDELYELYRPEPRYDDEVAELLDMYEQAQEPVYEQYVPEEVYPEIYPEEEVEVEEQFPQYVPSKRQMISSLPGIKKRYFYPFSPEPDTHWGAFVPKQKRSDYDEAYSRLIALASALSEESPYYQQQYRKK